MSDLSIPREAADWAGSFIREESLGPLAFVRRSPGHAKRRIAAAIAELQANPVQAKRCAEGIAVLESYLALASEAR